MNLIPILVYLVILLVVGGFVLWIIESAPFISATVKPYIRWCVVAIFGLVGIYLLLALVGVAGPLPVGPIRIR